MLVIFFNHRGKAEEAQEVRRGSFSAFFLWLKLFGRLVACYALVLP